MTGNAAPPLGAPGSLGTPTLISAGNRYSPRALVTARLRGGEAPANPGLIRSHLEAIDADLAAAAAEEASAPEVSGALSGSVAAWIVRIAIAMQRVLFPIGLRGTAHPTQPGEDLRVVVETMLPGLAGPALSLAARVVFAAGPEVGSLAAEYRLLRERQDEESPGINQLPIVQALDRRRIGWRWQALAPRALLIGEARWRRRVSVTITDRTSYLAGTIAENKAHCNRLLAHHRMPVPRQRSARTAEAAVAAAEQIGFPVVVKPIDRSGGVGVSVGLRNAAEVEAAFARARVESRIVVVESMLVGEDHRLLVIGERMVAASRRLPAHVVGDGVRSVGVLIAAANADPRRRGPAAVLRPLAIDAESVRLMARQGQSPDGVPSAGERVWLRSAANRSQGGMTEDVTARVHPDNAWLAVRAARLVGLDVAGIDMIMPDVSRSVLEAGGGICEVNRNPALLTHVSADRAPDVGAMLLDHVLGDDRETRVPIVLVVGDGRADAIVRAVADRLAGRGIAVGTASDAGLVSARLPLIDPGPGDPRRVEMLVNDPNVDAIVVAATPEALARRGFGHGRCDVAVGLPDGAEPDLMTPVLGWMARLGARTAALDPSMSPSDLAARIDTILDGGPG